MSLKVYDKRIECSYRNLRSIEKDGCRFTKSRGHIQRRRNPYQRDYGVLFGIVEIHVGQNPSNCTLNIYASCSIVPCWSNRHSKMYPMSSGCSLKRLVLEIKEGNKALASVRYKTNTTSFPFLGFPFCFFSWFGFGICNYRIWIIWSCWNRCSTEKEAGIGRVKGDPNTKIVDAKAEFLLKEDHRAWSEGHLTLRTMQESL